MFDAKFKLTCKPLGFKFNPTQARFVYTRMFYKSKVAPIVEQCVQGGEKPGVRLCQRESDKMWKKCQEEKDETYDTVMALCNQYNGGSSKQEQLDAETA